MVVVRQVVRVMVMGRMTVRRRRVGRGAGCRSRSRRRRCCLVVVVINAVVLVVGVLDVARRRCCCCCYAAGVMAEVRGRSHEGMSRPCKETALLVFLLVLLLCTSFAIVVNQSTRYDALL